MYSWISSNNCNPGMAKSAWRELMAHVSTYESRSYIANLHSKMRSQLSLSDPNSVSTILKYPAATENQLQNQA